MRNFKLLGLSALLAAALAAGIGTAPSSAAASPGNVYEALTSCRLVDTRDPNTVWMAPNSLRVDVKSHCGVPSSATAAAFTVTVTQTTAPALGETTSPLRYVPSSIRKATALATSAARTSRRRTGSRSNAACFSDR